MGRSVIKDEACMAYNQHPNHVSMSLERKFAASFSRSGGDLLVFPNKFPPWKIESIIKLRESGTHLRHASVPHLATTLPWSPDMGMQAERGDWNPAAAADCSKASTSLSITNFTQLLHFLGIRGCSQALTTCLPGMGSYVSKRPWCKVFERDLLLCACANYRK